MFKINDNYLKLPGSYLFSTIAKKVTAYTGQHPEQEIIRLGIGDVTLPLAAPGLLASAIFVFLESLDEFTGSYFVGAPDVNMLPLLLYSAGAGGNYQIASITALLLLVPSILFMLFVERFLKADVLASVGK